MLCKPHIKCKCKHCSLFVICVCAVTTKYGNNLVFSLCPVSAGVGRTGCFIVIEAMLERMNHEKSVDIYGHVTCMRAQRNYMVQTEDQYIFIHEALLEAAICGHTEVPARNLYAHLQKLMQIPAGETVTTMELEFKVGAFSCLCCVDGVYAEFELVVPYQMTY